MKITIITVVWNNKDTIKDAIESVLNQTYKTIEYIERRRDRRLMKTIVQYNDATHNLNDFVFAAGFRMFLSNLHLSTIKKLVTRIALITLSIP